MEGQSNEADMRKIHAFLLVVKADIAALGQSPTLKADKQALITEVEGMLPDIFSVIEATFAKILLAAL